METVTDEGSVESMNTCDLTVIESCRPNYRTCSVRCCEQDKLINSPNTACGDCQTIAHASCAPFGGPRHIRWLP